MKNVIFVLIAVLSVCGCASSCKSNTEPKPADAGACLDAVCGPSSAPAAVSPPSDAAAADAVKK